MFKLPDLPYVYDALEPTLSARTLRFHHDNHHATYVKTLNAALEASGATPASLEVVIRENAGSGDPHLFNNAAQAWNHGFFWCCMTPAKDKPIGDLAAAIQSKFGGLDRLREAFVKEGVGHFGSGWVWLSADRSGALSVASTHDAHDMVTTANSTPLLVCDLWEHAYYLDYQSDRQGFLQAWFDTLANWKFAAAQWAAAKGEGSPWLYAPPIRATETV